MSPPMKLRMSAAHVDPAHGLLLHDVVAGQQLGHHIIQFAQRSGLHPAQRGDAQQHVIAQTFRKVVEHVAGLVALQVHQDGCDGLGMFVMDEIGDRFGVHPFQAFDAAGIAAAAENPVQQRGRLVVAQRLGEYAADIVV